MHGANTGHLLAQGRCVSCRVAHTLCTGPDTALQTSGRVNLPRKSLYLPRSGVIAPSEHVLTWTAGFLVNLGRFGAGVIMLDTGSLERLHGLSCPPPSPHALIDRCFWATGR